MDDERSAGQTSWSEQQRIAGEPEAISRYRDVDDIRPEPHQQQQEAETVADRKQNVHEVEAPDSSHGSVIRDIRMHKLKVLSEA